MKYISKRNQFIKLNEQHVNDQKEIDREIKNSFLTYVSNLPEFLETNKEMLESEKNWNEEDDFEDIYSHGYALHDVLSYELEEENDEEIQTIPESIEYVIFGVYHGKDTNEREFHVYENGKFRKASYDEDSFLRSLDDDQYFGDQDGYLSLDYYDWKKTLNQTKNVITSINN